MKTFKTFSEGSACTLHSSAMEVRTYTTTPVACSSTVISVTIRDYFWKRQGSILLHLLEFLFCIISHSLMSYLKRKLSFAGIKFRNWVEINLGEVLFSVYCMHQSTPPVLFFVKLTSAKINFHQVNFPVFLESGLKSPTFIQVCKLTRVDWSVHCSLIQKLLFIIVQSFIALVFLLVSRYI